MSLEVVRPGPLALVEDLGRPGFAAVGVSPSGAFDVGAFALGASLVGNDAAAAAIEVVLGGLVVRLRAAHVVALTGAECPVALNGAPVPWNAAFGAGQGDVLALGPPASGLRSYLSVAGGIDVPSLLGSRSTDLLSGLGPARLRAGDVLAVGAPGAGPPERASVDPRAPGRAATMLQLLPGPRTDWLADPTDLAGDWTVSPDSNRVGVRLAGRALARAAAHEAEELPPEPLVRGAVQLPPSGQPVAFGPDHPTTGGYPVIGVLTEAGCDALAQCRPGDQVRFSWAGLTC